MPVTALEYLENSYRSAAQVVNDFRPFKVIVTRALYDAVQAQFADNANSINVAKDSFDRVLYRGARLQYYGDGPLWSISGWEFQYGTINVPLPAYDPRPEPEVQDVRLE